MLCPLLLQLRLDAATAACGIDCVAVLTTRQDENFVGIMAAWLQVRGKFADALDFSIAGAHVVSKGQCVPHFLLFSSEVAKGVRRRGGLAGNLRDDFDTGI